jgi:FkbM family methyltransferase
MLLSRFAYYLSSLPALLSGMENWWLLGLLILGARAEPTPILRLRRSRLRFRVRTAMDIWVVKEVCLDREYERGGVALLDGWTFVDVGAGIGDFSISIARRFPGSRVVALEPYRPSYQILLENLRLNGAANVQPHPIALGAGRATLPLRAGTAEPGQSSTARGGEGVGPKVEEVPARSLAALLEELAIPHCDFLKMDCEGAEYEILMSSDPGTLGRIRHLALEYHDGYTRHQHGELEAFLESNGFRVRTFPSRAHREIGYLFASQA